MWRQFYLNFVMISSSGLFENYAFKEFAPSTIRTNESQSSYLSTASATMAPSTRVWPQPLAKWLNTFLYLLSFFPHRTSSLEPLHLLKLKLIM